MVWIKLFFFFGTEFTIFVPMLWGHWQRGPGTRDGECRVRVAQCKLVSAILTENASTSQQIVINPDGLDMSPLRGIKTRVAIVLFEIWQTTNEIHAGNLSHHNFWA